jgi:ubiquinone/menaquinone biosynthesis C-methylase UbiE
MTRKQTAYLLEQIEMHKKLTSVYTEKRYAPAYSQIYQRHWNRTICRRARLAEDQLVLDYGAGTGILFPEIDRCGSRYIGLDLSPDMLAAARKLYPKSLQVCADGSQSPFADNQFDCVVCRGSIHHLPDIESSLKEIFRILRPAGKLFFSEPANDSIINKLVRGRMYRCSDEFHDEDEGFERSEMIPLLKKCGFFIEFSRGFGFFAYVFSGFPDKLGVLKYIPGNKLITRLFIALDTVLEHIPIVNRFALHWQVCASKVL